MEFEKGSNFWTSSAVDAVVTSGDVFLELGELIEAGTRPQKVTREDCKSNAGQLSYDEASGLKPSHRSLHDSSRRFD